MQRHKSAVKRVRTNKKRYKKNRATKTTIKAAVKNIDQLIDKKASAADLQKPISKSVSLIDKATTKGIIKKNTARRKKSVIMRKVNEYISVQSADTKGTKSNKKESVSKKSEEMEKPSSTKN
ncbi:MAG: 30S ribosomal protein S20 [bacterium]|nr:30S ribosomal protein S20 [bacterium]